MSRRLYDLILRLHPSGFRHRFANELRSIFDEATVEGSASLPFLFDGVVSLGRQWFLRSNVWRVALALFAATAQMSWFVWGRKGHGAWPENPSAITPDTTTTLLTVLALLALVFVNVLGLMFWTVHFGRRQHRPSRRKRQLGSGGVVLLILCCSLLYAQPTVHKISVGNGVQLEVLDWGGNGKKPALVFLAGSGFDAHVWNDFAPRFTRTHSVYAITRRGFGASDKPTPTDRNYGADQLGDDVLAVCNALRLQRPVLVGHSLAGEELSSIGSRYPDQVSGLIYLDAAYSYAFYTPQLGDWKIDAVELQRQLNQMLSQGFNGLQEIRSMQRAAAQLDKDLQALRVQQVLLPLHPPRPVNAPAPDPIQLALAKGGRRYTQIPVPVLAIFADPHRFEGLYADNPKALAAVVANDREMTSAQADAFATGVPSARVVRIPNADHFVFQSNEAQVEDEINRFLGGLH